MNKRKNLKINKNVFTKYFETYDEYKDGSYEEIYDEENGTTTSQNGLTQTTNYDANSYKGQFYYFGTWKESNALYDIQKNYFVK